MRVLRRRAWVVVTAILVTVVGSVALSQLQTPMYAATSRIELKEASLTDRFDFPTGQRVDPVRRLDTQVRVIESRAVQARVLENLPGAPPVSASGVGQTDLIDLRVESEDPVLAQAAADAYAEAYLAHSLEEDQAEITRVITGLEERIAQIEDQIAAESASERRTLESTRDTLLEIREDLRSSFGLETGGARVLEQALLPSSPFSPQPLRNAILAFVLGSILGVGLAFLVEYLDDSVRTKEDIERASGLPAVGLIPEVAAARELLDPGVISLEEPTSAAAEAYRTLRTSVQFMGFDKPLRVIQVTSPSAAEGKTTTVANLAVALARAGREVTVVCCDLRRPRLHQLFGLDNEVGFTSVLLRDATLADALQRVPGLSRLTVLTSGPVPPNPAELLSSQRAAEVLAELQGGERLVLVDSPPVLPVTDALVISRAADVTLMVCSATGTRKGEAARAVEMLQRVGAPIVGTVLNGVKHSSRYGYDYRNHYRPYAVDVEGKASNGNGARTHGRRFRRHARRS